MIALVFALSLAVQPAADVTWNTLDVGERAPLEYAIVTPDDFDASVPHPVLLALPPGAGGRDMVERGLELYFAEEARRRGWVVVSPAAPDGTPFRTEDAAWIPALLEAVASRFAVEGGTFHLAGVSNGGRGAYRVASEHAGRFASLTVLPGRPAEGIDAVHLAAIATLPIAMFVGEQDAAWLEASINALGALRAVGAARVSLDVLPGEGHVLDGALAVDIFDRLDALRDEQRMRTTEIARVSAVLDDLHDAAAVADEERYFGLFLPGAIFVGTDATERWTIPQFRVYAKAPFQGESAWIYEPLERHVTLSRDRTTAWFFERLMNANYRETRGSGVLHLRGDRWRIAQYVLSFAVPNGAAADVVEAIKQGDR